MREAPGLAATEMEITPLPLPLPPAVIVTNVALLTAFHVQPAPVLILKLVVPPPTGTEAAAVERTYVHPADWVTVKVCPAIVIVPVSVFTLELAATEKDTVPFPSPLPPDVTVIHETLLTAVHTHPLPAVTFTAPVPPLAPKFAPDADNA